MEDFQQQQQRNFNFNVYQQAAGAAENTPQNAGPGAGNSLPFPLPNDDNMGQQDNSDKSKYNGDNTAPGDYQMLENFNGQVPPPPGAQNQVPVTSGFNGFPNFSVPPNSMPNF